MAKSAWFFHFSFRIAFAFSMVNVSGDRRKTRSGFRVRVNRHVRRFRSSAMDRDQLDPIRNIPTDHCLA
jgi:hypothetical protein